MMNWKELWMTLFGTTKWLGLNIGFWVMLSNGHVRSAQPAIFDTAFFVAYMHLPLAATKPARISGGAVLLTSKGVMMFGLQAA